MTVATAVGTPQPNRHLGPIHHPPGVMASADVPYVPVLRLHQVELPQLSVGPARQRRQPASLTSPSGLTPATPDPNPAAGRTRLPTCIECHRRARHVPVMSATQYHSGHARTHDPAPRQRCRPARARFGKPSKRAMRVRFPSPAPLVDSDRATHCRAGRRRAPGSRAGFWKELSAGLMVVPGGTISSMRSSTSSLSTTSAAASWE